MSGENLTLQSGSAETIENEAAAWLWRRSSKDWRDEDQAALDKWVAESHNHLAAFWRLEAAWERTARLAALRQPEPKSDVPPRRNKMRIILSAFAVTVACAGVFGVALERFWPTPERVYSTNIGGHAAINLADGTRVELNTNTVMRADMDGESRIIYLDKGEAYFTVHHDAGRPFTVVTRNNRISDLGTKFVVRENSDSVRVSLIEGRVRLESSSSSAPKHSAFLAPGDVAIATGNAISVVKKSNADLSMNLGWRHGVIVFKDTTLADAVSEFNRYNNQKLLILDPDVARHTISGTIATTGIETFTRAVRNMLALRAEKRGDVIVISR